MTSLFLGLAFSLFTALVVIAGDTLIKLAADGGQPVTSRLVLLGCLLYAGSAVFWYAAMRHITLAQGGVAFSMFSLIALALIGAAAFGEPIREREAVGIGFALVAMVLMARIA